MEKQYEAFNGLNVRLRYFLRFTIFVRRSLSNIVKEKDFWVHNYQVRAFRRVFRFSLLTAGRCQMEPETNNPIKMEVGIEECLHIGEISCSFFCLHWLSMWQTPKEFEYNKSKYHLRDVVIGKIYFILVRIKIKVSWRAAAALFCLTRASCAAHGGGHHQAREHGLGDASVQRERDADQV